MPTHLGVPRRHPAVPGDNPHRVRVPDRETERPFADVLCAVTGDGAASAAVRQATALTSPGRVETHAPCIAPDMRFDRGEIDGLLAKSAGRDLLAIDCHDGSTPNGTMLDGVATQVAHRATVPLLIARPGRDQKGFPRAVLLASDGSPGSWAAALLAARIARAHGSSLRLVYVPDGHPERYRELFKQVSEIERITGSMPTFLDSPGDPARRIAETARAERTALLVVGRRGRQGPRSLGSVSERVAQRAPCSVLIVPAETNRRAGSGGES